MTTAGMIVTLVLAFIGAVLSYRHTRRYGTKRNVRTLYPLMIAIFFVAIILQETVPHRTDDFVLITMIVWVSAIGGSLLTWRRINYRGLSWAQIVKLRERRIRSFRFS